MKLCKSEKACFQDYVAGNIRDEYGVDLSFNGAMSPEKLRSLPLIRKQEHRRIKVSYSRLSDILVSETEDYPPKRYLQSKRVSELSLLSKVSKTQSQAVTPKKEAMLAEQSSALMLKRNDSMLLDGSPPAKSGRQQYEQFKLYLN